MAAALGPDDSPALHAADTIAAGDGLCDAAIVDRFARAAPEAIEKLARLGVRFDRKPDGGFALGLEAAHSRSRIAHVGGDGAGRELMRALVAAARATPSITILEGFEARRLLVEDNAVRGLVAIGPSGPALFATDRVVIATGGIGGLYAESTNPLGSFGQGLALAARAGAVLADMEFVQFHPTALDVPTRPVPLVSEAVRGEGAKLIDERGERFMAEIPGAELAPRDVVARAIWRLRMSGGRAFLDARAAIGEKFAARFPAIAGGLPRRGHRSGARADPSAAGAALSHGRDRGGRRGAELCSRASGPAAKRPRPGSTARTGSRAIRSPRQPSTPRSSRARSTPRNPARSRRRAPRGRRPPPIRPPSARSSRAPRASRATARRSPPPSARSRRWRPRTAPPPTRPPSRS